MWLCQRKHFRKDKDQFDSIYQEYKYIKNSVWTILCKLAFWVHLSQINYSEFARAFSSMDIYIWNTQKTSNKNYLDKCHHPWCCYLDSADVYRRLLHPLECEWRGCNLENSKIWTIFQAFFKQTRTQCIPQINFNLMSYSMQSLKQKAQRKKIKCNHNFCYISMTSK